MSTNVVKKFEETYDLINYWKRLAIISKLMQMTSAHVETILIDLMLYTLRCDR